MNGGATRSATIPPNAFNTNSVVLDGTGDFVEVAHDAGLDVTTAYTLGAWVNVDDISTHRPILFRGSTDSNDIEVYYQRDNGLIVAHNRDNGGTFDWVRFVLPPVGSYFHLAVTFDGTDVQAYYDGVLAAVNGSLGATGTLMGAPDDTDTGWWIGKVDHNAFGGGGLRYFVGHIDDVRIYDVVLTEDQIADLANPADFNVVDGCGDAGSGGNDIDEVYATSDGIVIEVTLTLCDTIDERTQYKVHFDYAGVLATDPGREGVGTADCLTTSDDTMKYGARGKITGPGEIELVDDHTIKYTVTYAELEVDPGDLVLVWADSNLKHTKDRAPDVNSDGCAKPEAQDEVMPLILASV